ncbi:ATP-Hypothetical protein cassette sub-family A member [Nesidiocoris tenuis]|uniref:ABC transporter domain-containing protein n=1 Tax=Nesidiocoris tenuis TaxID=355587 RepID=A0ABN7AZS1_9HEMI|nr:ATP-Hypothetical protein cassette sub-family A member [Nesidiocoris tenuis]
MKRDFGRPSPGYRRSVTREQDREVNVGRTPRSVSGAQIINALGYRFWCLFLHRYLIISIFIALPVLFSLIFLWARADGAIEPIENELIGVTKPRKIGTDDLLKSCKSMYPIGVSPDDFQTKIFMVTVATQFQRKGVDFGPIVFKSDADDLYNYMATESAKSQKVNCGFGINVMIMNDSLSYTLRSVKSNGWYTQRLFPDIQDPGPMNNGKMYLDNGFLALQSAINMAYINMTFMKEAIKPVFNEFAKKRNISTVEFSNATAMMQFFSNLTGPELSTIGKLAEGAPKFEYWIQGFPYPSYRKENKDNNEMYLTWCRIILLYTILLVSLFALWMAQEKFGGMREMLVLNGIKLWMVYASWFFMFGLLALILSTIVTICWKFPVQGGALLPKSNPLVILTIIFLYSCSSFACIGFICSLVTSQTHTIIAILLYCLFSVSDVKISVFALVPNIGLFQIFYVVIHYEVIGEGAYFTNFFDDPKTTDAVPPFGISLLIMSAGMVMFVILMAYVDTIKPGPYGRAKPWYFVVNYCRSNSRTVRPSVEAPPTAFGGAVTETTNANKPFGLKVVDLVKKFGNFKALDDLSLTIYKNEITVLLGHNGAGKTTFFSIICGMFSPTSGQVHTDSYSVFSGNNLSLFRRDLGYCPQHSLVYSDLTVHEHLVFFGMVKGFTKTVALRKSDIWTKKFEIYHRRDKTAKHLSGGMKRKLSLAIAVIGDPLILLLDEPTSGLDPESRRSIWDLLLSLRGNRTIVISTHDMEEADILSDRIAIIANGSLKCFGSGAFLKHHYGAGYQLKISSRKGSGRSVINLIRGFVPSARLLDNTGKEIVVSLPSEDVRNFPALFAELDLRYSQDDYALSSTNMGDVFVKVQEEQGVTTLIAPDDMPFLPKDDLNDQDSKPGGSLRQTVVGLIAKHCAWARRKWFSLVFFIMIVPILIAILAAIIPTSLYSGVTVEKNLSLDLAIYNGSLGFIVNRGNDSLAGKFESLVTKSGCKFKELASSASIVLSLLDSAKTNLSRYRSEIVFGLESGKAGANLLYSTLAYHSSPILSGALANAYLESLNISSRIFTFNFPYDFNRGKECKKLDLLDKLFRTSGFLIGIGTVVVYFVVFPHIERVTRFKHLQFMTAVHPLLYWVLILIVDVILYLIGISSVLVVLLLIDPYNLYYQYGILNPMAAALCLHSLGLITTCYLASYLFKNSSTSMGFVLFVIFVCLTIRTIILLIFGFTNWLNYILNLVPSLTFLVCLLKIFETLGQIVKCESCPPVTKEYCEDYIDLKEAFFDITKELIYLALVPFLHLVIICLIDYGLFRGCIKKMKSIQYGEIESTEKKIDANVTSEKQAVEAITTTIRNQGGFSKSAPTFVCDGLGKKFSETIEAVRDVSFVVPKEECFGLLGTNGAGKSTTFEMLTGVLTPTKGDAHILPYSLSTERRDYLRRLGYCPQQDGLLPELSAREHLMLFGRLRGVPSDELPKLVQKWIDVVDMTHICDRPCQTYSGGNKRKLNTAIALIGDPPVVLLDEPTTGVDPVMRRKVWTILKHCQETNGQTIILTSHSMDECEATCERLTIMVNGRMKCIGTIPYLKNAYGRAFIVAVKLTADCTDEQSNRVEEKIKRSFAPHARVLKRRHGLLSISIDSVVTLRKVFQEMINLKTSLPKMENFTVTNISLEQVFMSIAEAK